MTIEEALAELTANKKQVRFKRLLAVCENFFSAPRVSGSHHIFKTKWAGDPRINLQSVKGKAKSYQVEQVIEALQKLRQLQAAETVKE